MNLNLSYQLVQDALDTNDGTMTAAGAHGTLAGMLCRNSRAEEEQWMSLVLGGETSGEGIAGGDLFQEMFEETVRLLDDSDLSFDIFLPDEETALSERAQALSEWCQGFLFGLGQAEQKEGGFGECEEVVRDFAEISRLDTESAGDDDEEAFTEICEFVRVGVQLIRGEFLKTRDTRRLH
jgi:uncharacterized protein